MSEPFFSTARCNGCGKVMALDQSESVIIQMHAHLLICPSTLPRVREALRRRYKSIGGTADGCRKGGCETTP